MPIRMNDVQPEPTAWLWESRIPVGALTILQGYPNCGKSSLTIDLAARVSRGDAMPMDQRPGSGVGRPVLFIAPEDSTAGVLHARLTRAGACSDEIIFLSPEEIDGLRDKPSRLVAYIDEFRPALVVVDPVTAVIGTGSEKQVRQVLRPWAMAAEQSQTSIVLVRHFQKDIGAI